MKSCQYCRRLVMDRDNHDKFCLTRIIMMKNEEQKYYTNEYIGFRNDLGEMNCFLNSVLQSL